jgi:hypothetical protein
LNFIQQGLIYGAQTTPLLRGLFLTLIPGMKENGGASGGQAMKSGEVVTVETFDHKLIDCRVVEVREKTALVCSEQEWRKAAREKRQSECLGWPLSSVQSKRASSSS